MPGLITSKTVARIAIFIVLCAVALCPAAYVHSRDQAHLQSIEADFQSRQREQAASLQAANDYGEMRTSQLTMARMNAEVPPEAFLFDVDAALAPITVDRLLQVREDLIRYVWKGVDPRSLMPDRVTDGQRTGNVALVVPDAAAKTLEVSSGAAPPGFTEFSQHGSSSSCLAIWAQGHEGGDVPGEVPITGGAIDYMKRQWAGGCDILLVPMPFRAQGNVEIDFGKKGKIWVGGNHYAMALLDSPEFSAFRLFFDPLFASLNWLEKNGHHYDKISIAGVSGGGWMSVVYPAIDDRITDSVSVAGSFPMYLRYLLTDKSLRDLGDWEQTYAPFYQVAGYFDLYLLSALGPNRHETLVYNAEDPCCFSGIRALTFLPRLERKARDLGIRVDGFVDNTEQRHDISEHAISRVLASMSRPGHDIPQRNLGQQSAAKLP